MRPLHAEIDIDWTAIRRLGCIMNRRSFIGKTLAAIGAVVFSPFAVKAAEPERFIGIIPSLNPDFSEGWYDIRYWVTFHPDGTLTTSSVTATHHPSGKITRGNP